MMQHPKVSFIVPVYKVEQYLERCVESILKQTMPDLEVILIDDGSPDNCPKMCDTYAAIDERVKVIHQPNKGLSAARNAGLNLSTGEYIIFVDSDDYVEETIAEELLCFCKQYETECCMCHFYKGNKRVTTDFKKEEQFRVFFSDELLRKWHSLYTDIETPAWAKIYKRTLFFENGNAIISYPEGRLFEDVMTTHLLVARANKVGIINKALYHYTYNKQSITHSRYSVKRFQDVIFAQETRYMFFMENREKYPLAYERMEGFFYLTLILNYCAAIYEKINIQKDELTKIRIWTKEHYNEVLYGHGVNELEKVVIVLYRYIPFLLAKCFFPLYKIIKG